MNSLKLLGVLSLGLTTLGMYGGFKVIANNSSLEL
jgi:hypothetical protein